MENKISDSLSVYGSFTKSWQAKKSSQKGTVLGHGVYIYTSTVFILFHK